MPPRRKKQTRAAATEVYPTGPALLGKLREVLNIPIDLPPRFVGEDARDLDRSMYRALAGETVEEIAVIRTCFAFGAALIKKDVVPSFGRSDAATLISVAVYSFVRQWDAAIQAVQLIPEKPVDGRVTTLAAAQLLVVDVAVRVAAWLALGGAHVPFAADTIPAAGAVMDHALRSTGYSLPKLADELKVPETTFYRWRTGKTRPADSNLDLLASYLQTNPCVGTPVGDLRRQLTVAAILERLALHLQPFDLDDAWRMFARTANRALA